MNQSAQAFYAAREFLLSHREDYDTAYRDFRWPEIDGVQLGARPLRRRPPPGAATQRALWIVEQDGSEAHWTFAELSARSNQVANWLREQGVARGDRVILMLGNQVELWETLLAAMKLGAVVIPATTLLTAADLRDRLDRGNAKHVVVGGADTGQVRRRRRRLHPDRGAATRPRAGCDYADAAGAPDRSRPTASPAARRHPAALLHLRHDGEAQARRAHARVLPGRAPVHDVLDRAGARRRPPQHLLAGLGEARVEQRLRAVDRRGVRARHELRAVRRRRRCWTSLDRCARHELLRAADRVADADPGRPVGPATTRRRRWSGRASRSTPR